MIRSLILLSLYSFVWAADKQPLDCSKLEKIAPGKNGPRRFQAKGDKFEEFDWEISKALNAAEPGNMVISPISLKVVLAMLYEGANGTTAQEIGNALDLTNLTRTYTRERFSTILKSLQTSKGEYEIKMGSHVFIDKSAQPKEMYLCKLQNFYNSFMETVDFKDSAAAVKVINNWASKVTEGHIQHLVSDAEDHSSTVMLLLNAVYFKGLWEVPFPENQTEPRIFYLNEKETVKVPMMNTTDQFLYSNIADLKARMIKLPYLGEKFSMYVMIPNSKDGLGTLINALGPNKALTEYFKEMYRTSVNLIMPKFEFVFTTSLRSTLEKLGMPSMFSQMAEFTEIAETKSGGLIVSNIIQKAGISVTEIGTVAHAATVAELMDKFGGSEETEQFIIDRPFLFFIQDETVKTTVFVGKVTNPANAKVKVNPVMAEPSPQCNGADSCQINSVPVKKDEGQGGVNPGNPEKMSFFDAQLLKEVSAKESGNFVISPASIKILLGMVMEGAESSTLTKLRTALRLPQDSDQAHQHLSLVQSILQRRTPGVIVDSHANIFVNKKYQVNTTYSRAIKQYYNADATSQDFTSASAAANNINNWVRNKTRGLIPTLIDEGMVDQDTLAVLVNAIYFDAKWKYEFMTADTADRCFYSYPAQECQKIPMMLKEQEYNYKLDKALESHVVQIPYADEKLSMLLVVPENRSGIVQLNYDAGQLTLPRLVEGLRKHEVVLKLPRFTIEYSSQLLEVMKEMGLEELFTENAQLPYMMNDSPGRVSAMVHKAKIEVSEKGTKAAAASGASVVPLMFGLNTIYLDVDHPFYYFIFEQETKTVLFSGRFSTADGQTQKNNPPPASQPPSSQPPSSQQGTNKPAGNTGRFRKDATA